MKKYLNLSFIILFAFSSNYLFAQVNNKVVKVEHSITNKITEYAIPIKNEGNYSIALFNPSGEVLSWPIKDQMKNPGSKIEFSINSKYWRSGNYRMQLMLGERVIDVYTITVGLSKRQKAKLVGKEN